MSLPPGGIEIVPVRTRRDLDRFIRLPERLHADDPHYIAPLRFERREALSPKTNPFFAHAQVQFWLALRGGTVVGRISAQIDRLSVERRPGIGHFGMIAAEDDPAIFRALLTTAEDWLRARGMTEVQGPLNLSTNEETGLLVDGFDTPPMLMMGHDKPYVGPRIEEQGYAKAKDVIAYLTDFNVQLHANAQRAVARARVPGLTLRMLDWQRFDHDVEAVTRLFNDAWSENWGFVPWTPAETLHLGKSLKLILDRRLAWFAEENGVPVGFIIALPNLNEAIRDLRGRLLPFGWAKLLWRLKVARVKSTRVALMGVSKKYARGLRGRLLPFLLIDQVRRGTKAYGYRTIEMSWILEDNLPMRRIIESLGSVAYKTYRVYGRSLTPAP